MQLNDDSVSIFSLFPHVLDAGLSYVCAFVFARLCCRGPRLALMQRDAGAPKRCSLSHIAQNLKRGGVSKSKRRRDGSNAPETEKGESVVPQTIGVGERPSDGKPKTSARANDQSARVPALKKRLTAPIKAA
jgi:hypothetical protein